MGNGMSEQARSFSSKWVKLWACCIAVVAAVALSTMGLGAQTAYADQGAPVESLNVSALTVDEDVDGDELTPGYWMQSKGGWWFEYEDGTYAVGYQYIETNGEGEFYYFDQNGWMVTGWHWGSEFVELLYGGYIPEGVSSWLYFKDSGAMAFGWEKVGGTWYYLDPDMLVGWWDIDGAWYFMNGSGAMETGWLNQGGTWYYLAASGAMQTGWQWIGGSWYYLDPETGAMATGWAEIDGTWYFMNGSGAMETGWLNQGGTWYYLAASGAMQTGWQWIGGSWYYLNTESGAMATGWAEVDGLWYYLNGSGAMQSNRWIGDYYLTASGAMATNTWIGNYYVGADGKWIPNYDANTATVYWVDNGEVYHTSLNCTSLKQSDNIKSGTIAESGKDRACKVCTH